MPNGQEEENVTHECKELLLSLPRHRGWRTPYIYQFQGFWCQPKEIQSILSFQKHFQARNNDVVIATIPKSGTTWLKALTFSILNRKSFPLSSKAHPLLNSNPHDLVPFFEYKVYANGQVPDVSKLPDPRLFATHLPFSSLQESIKKSSCKIVYICRNPFDTFISSWIYINKLRSDTRPPLSLDDCFNMYCKGIVGFGPFWDHMLGYWNESKERPDKVLFLKYEDMKEDISFHLKKLAEFLGCPFSMEEEKAGEVEEVAKLCSLEKLKDLEVNKSGKSILNFENRHLFRKGEVGDWVNHLSPSMVERLTQVMEEKLGGSGLQFKVFS
ncbi:Flavonol 4'-sulfotransferase, putative [Ricinus communis]|uniref:Sulfotransferase n=2 Tax=Ricinus communis TaxID=3988 RepID=B9TIQ1_RICCO|nr:Flavonol 4'-sulfotransferase, putative [Ricinus communis]|eukprot:XP_002538120.1 cytosolic sulfotransferase 15 [Ricinus communis]